MKKYTLQQFNNDYPDDDACLHKLYLLRFKDLICPKCENTKEFTRVKERRSYQCPCCGFQVYPTATTVFHKSTTPLRIWFHIIFMQTTTRNGVAAKVLERVFDVSYKTALRMSHQIKILMANKSNLLTGIIETDETFIGGEAKNKHANKKTKTNAGGTTHTKQPVLGMLQRSGNIIAKVVESREKHIILPYIYKAIERNATIMTDEYSAYRDLKLNYNHFKVKHTKKEYVRGIVHTNTLEGFWSQLKRTIRGTHIHVSSKHLQKYVDECVFRYVNSKNQENMFNLVLARVIS